MSDDVDAGQGPGSPEPPWNPLGDAPTSVSDPVASDEPIEAEMVGPGWDAAEPERTDGGAIAALVLAIASFLLLPLIGSVVALFLAAGADQRIATSGGTLGGAGMVKAAKIVAWVHLALLAVAAVSLLLVLLVANASDETLDLERAEDEITESLQTEYVGVSVERVTCPDDVKVEEGATFTCTTQIDGQDFAVTVTQADDQGNVRFAKAQAAISVADAEAFIAGEYRKQGTVVTVGCSDKDVLVADPGSTIECLVAPEDSDGTTAVVTVQDVNGNVGVDFTTAE